MKPRQGYTMIEFIIAAAVVAVMAVIMITAFNPKLSSDKGFDTRRKSDIRRIKLAFEEYFNDKDCYPTQSSAENYACGSSDFSPWLSIWPCDPNGSPYKFRMDGDPACPTVFRIFTDLQNRKDKDIPAGWYSSPPGTQVIDDLTIEDVNYGVSSTNVLWNKP